MASLKLQTLWCDKYEKKNDTLPPEIYGELNTSLLSVQPGNGNVELKKNGKLPKLPEESEFPKFLEVRIVASNAPKEDVQYAIVVLHGYAADLHTLTEFAKTHLLGPRTVCILVRGTTVIETGEGGGAYCWSDKGDFGQGPDGRAPSFLKRAQTGLSQKQNTDEAGPSRSSTFPSGGPIQGNDISTTDAPTFQTSTAQVGIEVISKVLVGICGFEPRDIAIVGHDQGGTAGLAVAAACCDIKLGGVVSIGGTLPRDFPIGVKSLTDVLLLGGALGDISPKDARKIDDAFIGTTSAFTEGQPDDLEMINDKELKSFLAHRLRREEWTREAVVTFDGGGIRGYGSLLMLRALMENIARMERELDNSVKQNGDRRLSESSFSPCEYPQGLRGPRPLSELYADQLYLPCHYFTFAGGTSTGGLISIMISRFRMTVYDCIEEYKNLGRGVFANPRFPGLGPIPPPWNKFNHNNLEQVIGDVGTRHGEDPEHISPYSSDGDLCKTIVAARADCGGSTLPFLFRTYDCHHDDMTDPSAASTTNDSRKWPLNAGPAANCNIVQVGRATSAAPGFFRLIRIPGLSARGYGELQQEGIRFVDGGFGLNNPSHEILRDIKHLRRAPNDIFEVFASFGTGRAHKTLKGKLSSSFRLLKEMKNEMTDVRRPHEAMVEACGIDNPDKHMSFKYFRFDGGEELGTILMDAWSGRRKNQVVTMSSHPTGTKTLESMNKAVADFLRGEKVQEQMEELARTLVLRRRLRTRDKSAWERYACASRYMCSQPDCSQTQNTLDAFLKHLADEHPTAPRYQCVKCCQPDCTDTLNTLDGLLAHLQSKHSSAAQYKCCQPDCDVSLSVFEDFQKHIRETHPDPIRGSRQCWEYRR